MTLLLLDKLSNGILTGHAARDAVANEMSELCTESGQLLHNILKKDLRCGFNVKTINAAIPNTIFHQPYMRCSIYEDGCISFPVHSQCKADGSYLSLTRLNEGGFDLRTRKGKKYPNDTFWEDILMSASKLFKGQQLHGELQVLRNGNLLSRKEANGILNSVRLGALLPTDCEYLFTVWDMLIDEELELAFSPRDYKERFELLVETIGYNTPGIHIIETAFCQNQKQVDEHYEGLLARKFEGQVLKMPDGLWIDGTSSSQFKRKPTKEADLVVLEKTAGNGRLADTFGALLCGTSDLGLLVGVSGFTDEERELINNNWDQWEGAIIAVKFKEVISKKESEDIYSLYEPRFVKRRYDKSVADTTERVLKL